MEKQEIKTETLDKFGINITNKAINHELDKVFGREVELENLIKILSRKKKNNAIIVGKSGTGKSSLLFLLAQRIVAKKVPTNLLGKVIYSIDSASIMAGTSYRGQMEERLKKILEEVESNDKIMLFIDEIHTILDTTGNNASNIANVMKPYLTGGNLQVIGATTLDEYKKFFEKDSALSRRFNRLVVEEPSIENCVEILKQSIDSYEKFHNISFSDEILLTIPTLAKKYIRDRNLPDSAFDVIDEIGAKIKVERTLPNPKLIKMLDELQKLEDKKYELIKTEDWTEIQNFKPNVYDKFIEKLSNEQKNFNDKVSNLEKYTITKNDVLEIVSRISKVPLSKLENDGREMIKNLEKVLDYELVNQNEAKSIIVKNLKKKVLNLDNTNRPFSLLLAGQTGVGKTRLCEVVAEHYFDNKMLKINGGELSEAHNVSKLIGSPSGFVGHTETSHLFNYFIDNSYGILLIDELEKIHPQILNVLLNILDSGECVDSQSRTISFRNVMIICTTNLGSSKVMYKKPSLGINQNQNTKSDTKDITVSEIKKFLTPELFNRISNIVVMDKLSKDDFIEIFNKEIDTFKKSLKEKNINLTVNKKVIEHVLNDYDDNYGARGIKRAFQDRIVDKIIDYIIDNEDIKKINIVLENEEIIIK